MLRMSSTASCSALLIVAAAFVGVATAWRPGAPVLAPSCRSGRLACRSAACARDTSRRGRPGLGVLSMVAANEAATPASTDPYDKAAWLRGWESAKEEQDPITVPADRITGEIPRDLVGTFYRNGPALFELGETKLAHPLDGDGMMRAWTFSGDGSCTFRSRFVRTEAHVKEQRAVQKGYKGPPVTRAFFSGGKGERKNCANTGAIYWGNRLLALYEAALPIELDPAGLHTIGATRIAQSLPTKSSFTARPKYDPASDRLVGMRYSPVAANAEVQFFEYDEAWQCVMRSNLGLNGHAIVHDFGVTRKHYVVHQAPSTINTLALSLGLQPPMACIGFDASKTGTFHIQARDGGDARKIAAPGSGFLMQIANMFEDRDSGVIVVDAIEMPRLPLGAAPANGSWRDSFAFERDVPDAKLVRWTIPPAGHGDMAEREVLDDAFQGFPEVNPYVRTVAHSFIYTAGGGAGSAVSPLRSVRKYDVKQGKVVGEYKVGPSEFVTGPTFVPRPEGSSEDDGYLLVSVLDGRDGSTSAKPTTRLEILDALDLNKGPLCSVAIDTYMPHSLYGYAQTPNPKPRTPNFEPRTPNPEPRTPRLEKPEPSKGAMRETRMRFCGCGGCLSPGVGKGRYIVWVAEEGHFRGVYRLGLYG
jgi:all-trans-8'-apo-beta-carotenal 15,15'-oxygenase